MKKVIISIIALVITSMAVAQNGFNYKALISDNGNVLANQVVSIKFTVLENGTTAVYQETQTGNTDANGIIAFNIGEGSVVSGDFSTIDWGSNSYFLKVEINTGSGYQDFGTTEFKYVPYAKYAEKAGNVFSGDFNDLTNVPAGLSDGDDVDDADNDPSNEIQTITKTGNTITLSNGGGSVTDSDTHLSDSDISAMGYIKDANDADHDPANEIQTISKTGNTITLSNGGGSVTDSDTHLSDSDIAAMGYIKDSDDADHDATNELQDLSLSGTQLSITNGTGVDFTNWDTDSTDDVQSINDLSDAKTTNYGVFLGHTSGANANSNGDLVAVGHGIMANATGADYSVGIGNLSLYSLTSGNNNVAIGYGTGHNLTTGVGNIFIGYKSGYNETGSNKLYIENSNSSTPLIGGDFSTDEVTINGSLYIKDGTQGAGKILVSDANGKGHWSNSLPAQSKSIILGPYNATITNGTNYQYLIKSIYYGAYYTNTTNTAYSAVIVPVNLPVGAHISTIVVYFKDNSSTNNYIIRILKNNVYSAGAVTLGNFTTSGASNNVRYNPFYLSETVSDNTQYLIYMQPDNNSYWTGGSDSALRLVKVNYTE